MGKESILKLPCQRQLHFATSGNPRSSLVVIFFSGILSIGKASPASIPPSLRRHDPHFIAPTIPGNGVSSNPSHDAAYHEYLCQCITTLLEHLHPPDNSQGNAIENLLVAGGSYGTVMAQMLFGANFKTFRFGRKIRGMLLLSPFTPFMEHVDHSSGMTWSDWLSVGPVSRVLPVGRVMAWILQGLCRDEIGAGKLLDMASFNKMGEEERARFAQYATDIRGMTSEELKTEMAQDVLKCSANWSGFIDVSRVLHSDWGFRTTSLGPEHLDAGRPVLIVRSKSDPLGPSMSEWLAKQYKFSQLRVLPGGHMSSLYFMDELWEQLLRGASLQSSTDE